MPDEDAETDGAVATTAPAAAAGDEATEDPAANSSTAEPASAEGGPSTEEARNEDEDAPPNDDPLSEVGGEGSTAIVVRGGTRTPSEPPQSPELRRQAAPPVEEFSWRTDVAEFVPLTAPSLEGQSGGGALDTVGGVGATPVVESIWPGSTPASAVDADGDASQTTPSAWQAMVPVVGVTIASAASGTTSTAQLASGVPSRPVTVLGPGVTAIAGTAAGPGVQPTQGPPEEMRRLRDHYDWQLQRSEEEYCTLNQRMGRLEMRKQEVQERWDRDRAALVKDVNRYAAVLRRYAIPLDDMPDGGSADSQMLEQWNNPATPSGVRPADGIWKSEYGVTIGGPSPGCGGCGGYSACGDSGGCGGCGGLGGCGMEASGEVRSGSVDGQDALDSKMRRLNGLLTENAQQAKASRHNDNSVVASGDTPGGVSRADQEASASPNSIATTLQAMFPHATVRTMADDGPEEESRHRGQEERYDDRGWYGGRAQAEDGGDYGEWGGKDDKRSAGDRQAAKHADARDYESSAAPEASNADRLPGGEAGILAAELQRSTKSQIDDRALRALSALPESDAHEVLRRVDDLVKAQGGRCRNLSSILQSVCRKLERRSAARGGAIADDVTPAPDPAFAVAPESTLAASSSSTAKQGKAGSADASTPSKPSRGDQADESSGSEAAAGDNRHGGEQGETGEEEDKPQGRVKKRTRTRRRRSRVDSDGEGGGADGAGGGPGGKQEADEEEGSAAPSPSKSDWQEVDSAERLSAAEAAARREEARTSRREAQLANRRERRRRAKGGELSDAGSGAGAGSDEEQGAEEEAAPTTDGVSGARKERQKRPSREMPPPPPPPPPPAALNAPLAIPDDDEEARRDYWTLKRIEKTASRGFEARRRGDRWELKLAMGGLDPPFTETGMDRYCKWLRKRLQDFRDENGAQALRRCHGEIDFSNNGLGNQAVWMLLETLSQFEVQAASLKLYKNHISQGGVLAICEFIRTNKRSGAVHEMHLSHNEIDDESAHELIRTLRDQPSRYPPRRPVENAEGGQAGTALVPVWVRLNQNRIVNPQKVLERLETEGVNYCNARNAHGCGPGRCHKTECPLVHLYLFSEQAPRRPGRDGDDYEEDRARDRMVCPIAAETSKDSAGQPREQTGAAPPEGGEAAAASRRKRGRRQRNRDRGGDGDDGGDDGGNDAAPVQLQ